MSKVFACFFPFINKSKLGDDKNNAFIRGNSDSSICELSYHHVDSVSKKALQQRILKLEKEKEALLEMMILQHENHKKGIYIQRSSPNKEKKNTIPNYYRKIDKKSKKQRKIFEESFSENTYDYINFD